MKISYHITREDFIDAQKLHRSKSPSPLGRAFVLIGKILLGTSVLLLIALAAVDRDRRLWASLAPLIIVLVLWLRGCWCGYPSTGGAVIPRIEGCSRNSPPIFRRRGFIEQVWTSMPT